MTSEPEGVTYEEAYAVDGLWATPQNWDGGSAIMYLYGGGYVISSPHSRRKLASHLANASGARALVPRYHLAPERPFPSAVEDAAADYRWLLEEGLHPKRTVVAGDSSADGLAVAAMLKLRDDGQPLPVGGVPISPWVDLACTGETLDARRECQRGPHGDQSQRAAHGRPVPPRRSSAHAARLAAVRRPVGLAAPAHRGGRRRGAARRFGAPRSAGMAGVDVTLYIGARM